VKENNSVRIWGSVGDNPKGSIKVDARYGNVTIE
jgi:hypothetical protein